MNKRNVLVSVLLSIGVVAGMPAGASKATINRSGDAPFLYQGRSYLPLKSTARFLGAPLRWDAAKGQGVMTYKGDDLVLTPNSSKALFAGRSVVLPSPAVVVNGVTYVPTEALGRYYNVPVAWDGAKSEVRIKGPSGWRTMKASSRSPWHGGPPPWAPAWGQRGSGTPGHSNNVKASGNAKPAAWARRNVTPRHPSNAKPNQSGKASANKKDR